MTIDQSSLAQVQARMAQIQAQFGMNRVPRAATTSSNGDFASALAAAEAGTGYTAAGNATPAAVIQDALRYVGVPYKWGGTDPATGLDCSGFVQRVYGDLGIDLPRVSADQAKTGVAVTNLASAQPGDLIAFGDPVDHIAIYAGNNRMIVAPHTGDVVKVDDVPSDWTAIRRVLPNANAALGAGASPYSSLFESSASKYGVSPNVLQAMAKAESGFNAGAVSKAGAQGLMQLMPATARGLGVDPFDPAQAIDGAASILAGNLKRYGGSLDVALAAYNAGPAAVQRYGGVPPYAETQGYVRRILNDLRPEA
jgi:hypothetical protein